MAVCVFVMQPVSLPRPLLTVIALCLSTDPLLFPPCLIRPVSAAVPYADLLVFRWLPLACILMALSPFFSLPLLRTGSRHYLAKSWSTIAVRGPGCLHARWAVDTTQVLPPSSVLQWSSGKRRGSTRAIASQCSEIVNLFFGK